MNAPIHANDPQQVAAALHVDPRLGLPLPEAIRRSIHYGKNVVHDDSENFLVLIWRLLHPMAPHVAHVLSDGTERIINAADLVPGDVIVVDSGADVPADARIVTADELTVDEGGLTGQSVPVVKSPDAVAAAAPLPMRRSMLYLGTHVVTGHATAIVTATGDATELARLAHVA